MEELPEWLQELWDINPTLARQAEKDIKKDRTIVDYLGNQDKGIRHRRIEENILEEKYNWNNPEKTFSYKWRTDHSKSLQTLLSNGQEELNIEVTDEIRCVAATIIQWLGTNIGMEFLRSTLKLEGYTLKK